MTYTSKDKTKKSRLWCFVRLRLGRVAEGGRERPTKSRVFFFFLKIKFIINIFIWPNTNPNPKITPETRPSNSPKTYWARSGFWVGRVPCSVLTWIAIQASCSNKVTSNCVFSSFPDLAISPLHQPIWIGFLLNYFPNTKNLLTTLNLVR